MINHHRLVVSLVGQLHLLYEAVVLVDRVVELAIGVRQLLAVHHELEPLGEAGFGAMHLRQRRHLNGIVGNESRLDKRTLTGLAEDLVDQLTLTHMLRIFDAEFLRLHADLIFGHSREIESGLLFDGIEDRQTAVRRFEIDLVIADLHLRRAVHGQRDTLQQVLGKAHHPVIILVLDVELHAGELRVVAAVHTFVAEVTADLVHALKSAYDEALEVELRRDTQVHIYVERVMMRDERTRTRTAGYLLQDRCLDLGITRLVKDLTHGAQDGRTFEEGVLHALVHHEVYIALTIALLRVIKAVVGHTVFVFDDRQGTERFGEDGQLLGMHRYLTHLGAEDKALDADEVADIEQLFENDVVHLLLDGRRRLAFGYRRLDIIAADIHLNAAFAVLQLDKRSLTHNTLTHQTTCDTNRLLVPFVKMRFDVGRMTGHFILRCRVGIDPHVPHRLQTLPSYNLLFT